MRETAKRASITLFEHQVEPMRIAVISDTHGRTSSVQAALAVMAQHNVEQILHCGDICDGDIVRLFPSHTHFVFGNWDYARDDIAFAVRDIGAALHGAWGQLDLVGRSIAFIHGDDPRLLHDLEHADTFDYLFHGHTHIAREHRTGKTRIINPGALQRVAVRTFLLLDLQSGEAESVTID